MISYVMEWFLKIIAWVFISFLCTICLPEGSLKKYNLFLLRLILLGIILSPLLELISSGDEIIKTSTSQFAYISHEPSNHPRNMFSSSENNLKNNHLKNNPFNESQSNQNQADSFRQLLYNQEKKLIEQKIQGAFRQMLDIKSLDISVQFKQGGILTGPEIEFIQIILPSLDESIKSNMKQKIEKLCASWEIPQTAIQVVSKSSLQE